MINSDIINYKSWNILLILIKLFHTKCLVKCIIPTIAIYISSLDVQLQHCFMSSIKFRACAVNNVWTASCSFKNTSSSSAVAVNTQVFQNVALCYFFVHIWLLFIPCIMKIFLTEKPRTRAGQGKDFISILGSIMSQSFFHNIYWDIYGLVIYFPK